jgi:antitoxin HicB
MKDYSILLQKIKPEDGGGWLATVSELPGCMSDGDTQHDAVDNVQGAISAWIIAAKRRGQQIPLPKFAE